MYVYMMTTEMTSNSFLVVHIECELFYFAAAF